MSYIFPGIDSILASDWVKLEEVQSLLEPFSIQTDMLQSDSQSMASIIPSLLNLECHLQEHPASKDLTTAMIHDLRRRFENLLDASAHDYNPVPAAACVLNPCLVPVLMAPEYAGLLHAAKMYIVAMCDGNTVDGPPHVQQREAAPATTSALDKFKFLASKLQQNRPAANNTPHGTMSQLNNYLNDVMIEESQDPFEFWSRKHARYSMLYEFAQDLLSAPASQAYVERIFSLCGLMTAGRRNRMKNSLEMRTFLKLNKM